MKNGLIVSYDQNLKNSSLYLGYLILESLNKKEKVSILDLYEIIKKENKNFNYTNMFYSLMFLYMNNLIYFNEPYIYANKND